MSLSVPEHYLGSFDERPDPLAVLDEQGFSTARRAQHAEADAFWEEQGDRRKPFSSIVEEVIHIDRRPFRFQDLVNTSSGTIVHDRSYLKLIYDLDPRYPEGCRNQVYQWARQTEKSTSVAIHGAIKGCLRPGYKGLFVQPRFSQVSVFSQQRFRTISEGSPLIASEMLATKNLWQVGMKEYRNGSIYNFRSCYLSADATRGVSSDFLNIDEIQDIPSDQIPVIEECQSHALPEDFFRLYSGTPKTPMNFISRLHSASCQFEWMVKCRWCPHWNFMDERVIGERSFICVKCGRELYPKKIKDPHDRSDYGGQWEAMRPSKLDTFWGVRVSQIQVPFQSFEKIRAKFVNPLIPFSTFQNEVLGLASESGEVPLTEQDIMAVCEERRKGWETPETVRNVTGAPLFMGIDHGTGIWSLESDAGKQSMPSFTVVVVGGMCSDGKFRIIHMEKFLGEKMTLSRQPAWFDEIARKFRVVFCGSDWGFGAINNERLIEEYGWTPRQGRADAPTILEFQSLKQKPLAKFEVKAGVYGRYMIDRTQCMTLLIQAIKKDLIRFPSWSVMKEKPLEEMPFVDDFTSLFIEYDEQYGTMSYGHTLPDDAFQATMLCYLAAKQFYGELVRVLIPLA